MVIFHSYVSLPEGSRGYMVVCCSLPKNADVCSPNMTWDGTYPRWPAKKNCQYLSICPGPTETALLTLIFFVAFASMKKIEIVLSWWVCIVLWGRWFHGLKALISRCNGTTIATTRWWRECPGQRAWRWSGTQKMPCAVKMGSVSMWGELVQLLFWPIFSHLKSMLQSFRFF